jgi:hypothetical protein
MSISLPDFSVVPSHGEQTQKATKSGENGTFCVSLENEVMGSG